MNTRKLTKGTEYDLDTLTPAGWTAETTEGYSCWDYFDSAGVYLGPDQDGIEPLFRDFGDLHDYTTGEFATLSFQGFASVD